MADLNESTCDSGLLWAFEEAPQLDAPLNAIAPRRDLLPTIVFPDQSLQTSSTMAAPWEDDFGAPMAGPSFSSRARNAPEDDDFTITDDFSAGRAAPLPQDLAEETPFQQLIRHWMNERHAPDILPGQEMLLGRLLDHIRKQVSVQSSRIDCG